MSRKKDDARHGGPEWRCRLSRAEYQLVEEVRALAGVSRAELLLMLVRGEQVREVDRHPEPA